MLKFKILARFKMKIWILFLYLTIPSTPVIVERISSYENCVALAWNIRQQQLDNFAYIHHWTYDESLNIIKAPIDNFQKVWTFTCREM